MATTAVNATKRGASATGERPNTRTKAPDERRADILASARKLFETKGIAATTFGDIAADVGVTRGLVYHYVGDKDHLVDEVLGGYIDDFVAAVRAWDAARTPGDVDGALRDCIAMFRGELFAAQPLRGTLQQAESAGLYNRFLDQAVAAVVDCFEQTAVRAYAERHEIEIEYVRETFEMTLYGLINLARSRPDIGDDVLIAIVRQTLRLDRAGDRTG